MNYKKLFLIFIIILLISYKDVKALSRSELTVLNLNPITNIDKPTNFTSVQGGVTTDKYVITLLINENENSNHKTAILVLNKTNYKLVRLVKNPIIEYDLGHANDCTFNSKTNELLVLSGRKINIIDLNNDSFTLKGTKELEYYYHGLGYSEEDDQYVLARGIEGGTIFEIRDSEFNIIREFKLKTNLTKQSLTVYQGNIYYVCYEAGMLTKHQNIYDGMLKRKENLIYVYNLKGKKKTIYYIPFSYRNIIFGEIENISFNNGKMLIQFNHANKAGYFTASYKSEVNSSISIETDEGNNNTYRLYLEEKEVLKTKSKDNAIPINLRYTEEGNYNYQIKNNNELIELEDRYKEILKSLEVNVYYDPVVNRLKVNSNAKELIFSRDYLYDKDDLKRVEETLIVDVPDTKNNDYYWLIGLIIILTTVKYLYTVKRLK
ncbi:MAG: hypothetical protein IJI58_06080 [Bacilli bacterium]|nr:hypothetical protein [Bacilli bacterium]